MLVRCIRAASTTTVAATGAAKRTSTLPPFAPAFKQLLERVEQVPAETPRKTALNHVISLARTRKQIEQLPMLLAQYSSKRLPLSRYTTNLFVRETARYQSPGIALRYLADPQFGLAPDNSTLEMLMERFWRAIRRAQMQQKLGTDNAAPATPTADAMLATFALHETYYLQPTTRAYALAAAGCYLSSQWDKARAVLAEAKAKGINSMDLDLVALAIAGNVRVSRKHEQDIQPASPREQLEILTRVLANEKRGGKIDLKSYLVPSKLIVRSIATVKQFGLQGADKALQEQSRQVLYQGRRDGQLINLVDAELAKQ
ncbi:hypothetical protein RI367_006097 [Sorochytrium milnesiophthora]